MALTDWVFNAWGEKYEPWDDDNRAPERVAEVLGMKRFDVPVVMEGGALEMNSPRHAAHHALVPAVADAQPGLERR